MSDAALPEPTGADAPDDTPATPAAGPWLARFRQDMPATVSFVNHLLNVAKAPALSASSTPSP